MHIYTSRLSIIEVQYFGNIEKILRSLSRKKRNLKHTHKKIKTLTSIRPLISYTGSENTVEQRPSRFWVKMIVNLEFHAKLIIKD